MSLYYGLHIKKGLQRGPSNLRGFLLCTDVTATDQLYRSIKFTKILRMTLQGVLEQYKLQSSESENPTHKRWHLVRSFLRR